MEKVVSDLKTFAHKGCKIADQKIVSFLWNFALLAGFFLVSVLLSALVKRCFVSRMQDFKKNSLTFSDLLHFLISYFFQFSTYLTFLFSDFLHFQIVLLLSNFLYFYFLHFLFYSFFFKFPF